MTSHYPTYNDVTQPTQLVASFSDVAPQSSSTILQNVAAAFQMRKKTSKCVKVIERFGMELLFRPMSDTFFAHHDTFDDDRSTDVSSLGSSRLQPFHRITHVARGIRVQRLLHH